MRLKNQKFFLWFNELVFPLFYLRHQGKTEIITHVRDGAMFNVRVNTSDILVIWEIWKAKIYDDARFPIKVEDVVVDATARGRGIGHKLILAAIEMARNKGATSVNLTSNPNREAANALYQKMGFNQRKTNVYRYDI